MVREQLTPLSHASVSINDVLVSGGRLEANVFNLEAKALQEKIQNLDLLKKPLAGEGGLVNAYHRPRFKRAYVDKPGVPFYQPGQIKEVMPAPARFVSAANVADYAPLRVKKGQLLLTCSGTVGDVAIVGEHLDGVVFSHDLIRLDVLDNNYFGYVYSLLRSKAGKQLITTSNYGAVVQHIEPTHLNEIEVPIPDKCVLDELNEKVKKSCEYLDESNTLFSQAVNELAERFETEQKGFEDSQKIFESLNINCVSASTINGRLEANYHCPQVLELERQLMTAESHVSRLSDKKFCSSIFRPTQFKRIYVEDGFGIPFFTGKSIGENNPSDTKYLSYTQHEDKIKELILEQNDILITRSGTIGKVVLVPKHWDGMAISDDIIIIKCPNSEIAGYITAWLSTPQGQLLIKRNAYGAVVQHIEELHVADVLIPELSDAELERIGSSVLRSSACRTEANKLEAEAVALLNNSLGLV